MKLKTFLTRFFITFGIALLANILLSVLWNYLIKDKGPVIDWETSFRMAVLFAVIIPLTQRINNTRV